MPTIITAGAVSARGFGFATASSKVYTQFNPNSYTTESVSTYRTLGVDPVNNIMYLSSSQDPDSVFNKYSIANNGSLTSIGNQSTNTSPVPKRQVSFKPPSSTQAIITGYATDQFALYTSTGNMFGTPSLQTFNNAGNVVLFNPWANAYCSANILLVSGNDVSQLAPYPSQTQGLMVCDLTSNNCKGIALPNYPYTSILRTTGLAYDPYTETVWVGVGANNDASGGGYIVSYKVNNPTSYANISFTFLASYTTNYPQAVEAIGCNKDYLWYGGNVSTPGATPYIRRCTRV